MIAASNEKHVTLSLEGSHLF